MDRRDFIKQSCFACLAVGAGITISSLSSCTTMPIIKSDEGGNIISVKPESFIDDAKAIRIRTKKLDHDILLMKAGPSYRAIYMECTHNHSSLSYNKKQIFCTQHGAEFDLEGKVTKGPADKDLKTFPVTVTPNYIIITLV